MTTCPRCRAQVVPNAHQCGYCGIALQMQPTVQAAPYPYQPWSAPAPPVAVPPERPRGGAMSVVIGVVAVVIVGSIILGGVWLVSEQSNDGDRVAPTSSPATTTAGYEDFSGVYEGVSSGVARVEVTLCEGSATGTAFLVAPDTMLTAYHVVKDATGITVNFDGTYHGATLVAFSPEDDVAVLQLDEAVETAHVFSLATEVPNTGTRIAAIGYPLDAPKTLTEGTVSGKDREITVDGLVHSGLIQTDTAINPGNSGGPLVDLDGQVIGIADAGMLKAQGIGYVVPSGKAAPYLEATPTEQPLATCY